jgi:hypothetical protein
VRQVVVEHWDPVDLDRLIPERDEPAGIGIPVDGDVNSRPRGDELHVVPDSAQAHAPGRHPDVVEHDVRVESRAEDPPSSSAQRGRLIEVVGSGGRAEVVGTGIRARDLKTGGVGSNFFRLTVRRRIQDTAQSPCPLCRARDGRHLGDRLLNVG